MFNKIKNSKKAQSTAEYAIMLGLVIAAVVAMQIYVQRTIKGKVLDASTFFSAAGANVLDPTGAGQVTTQYEPYYLDSDYTTERDAETSARFGNQLVQSGSASNSTRTGGQTFSYTQTNRTFP